MACLPKTKEQRATRPPHDRADPRRTQRVFFFAQSFFLLTMVKRSYMPRTTDDGATEHIVKSSAAPTASGLAALATEQRSPQLLLRSSVAGVDVGGSRRCSSVDRTTPALSLRRRVCPELQHHLGAHEHVEATAIAVAGAVTRDEIGAEI